VPERAILLGSPGRPETGGDALQARAAAMVRERLS